VEGFVYFPGGGRAADCAVSVSGPEGTPFAELITDDQGAFVYVPTQACDHVFKASSADGHVAAFTVFRHQLPGTMAGTPEDGDRKEAEPAAVMAGPGKVRHEQQWFADDLRRAVDAAVQKQVRPLREEVELLRNETRMRDVVGGIGYIVGVFGLIALLMRGKGPAK
jgi:nickel transport protein